MRRRQQIQTRIWSPDSSLSADERWHPADRPAKDGLASICRLPMGLGKSASLTSLAPWIESARIPPFLTSCLAAAAGEFALKCREQLGCERYAVRSDAYSEDRSHLSQAGKYSTLLDVPEQGLAQAIKDVVNSMPGHARDQVMVQAMVTELQCSGVASTHRISDGAPWYCVEMAPGDSAAVTSGRATGRIFALARDQVHQSPSVELEHSLQLVLDLLTELEELLGAEPFEIEFALSAGTGCTLNLHLLQVRPITVTAHWLRGRSAQVLPAIDFLHDHDDCPQVLGSSTVLSLMADWNPAELIGSHPRPLAMSLFKSLITRGVWWRAREALGYAPAPAANIDLLRPLGGRPWVDVRRSANSLLPAGLPTEIGAQLVEGWMARLGAHPELHDKVEFSVFRTVRDFGSPVDIQSHWAASLDRHDLHLWEAQLGQLTRNMLAPGGQSQLPRQLAIVQAVHLQEIGNVPWPALLDRCRRVAHAFAILARLAFVAQAQLRSAVQRGALSQSRAVELQVAGRSSPMLREVQIGEDLWTLHGRMRPGTFDITQMTWAEQEMARPAALDVPLASFVLNHSEHRALGQLIGEAELNVHPQEWLQFVQRATQAREWGKFVFGRQLSAALDGIAAELAGVALSREQASWLTLEQIGGGMALQRSRQVAHWQAQAGLAMDHHGVQSQMIVSPILRQASDRYLADSLGVLPNFVGRTMAEGRIAWLDGQSSRGPGALAGAIVVIEKADPGFDWLFHHHIAGLVTAWGGPNSHMAIRCAEFGLCAAIGCGEAVLRQASHARHARIDPVAGTLWLL